MKRRSTIALTSALAATFAFSGSASGDVKIGEAVLIQTTVTGNGGTMAVKSPVHRDERIRSSDSGLGEFVFRDGTKFAVGRNSSVVVDKFVFDDSRSVQALSIDVTKGSFRWISGASKSSAYSIRTPAGTIGIRGTALDFYVGNGGTTAVVLLSGAARFCGANGCQELKRRCDVLVATPRDGVTAPKRLDQMVLRDLRNVRALPFLSGDQQLSGKFRVRHQGCQLAAMLNQKMTPAGKQTGTGRGPSGSASSSSTSTDGASSSPSESGSGGRGNNGRGNGGGDGSPNNKWDDDQR